MPFTPPLDFNMADYFLDSRVREGLGEKTALLCKDQKLTYRQVQALANRFGNALRGLGVEIENRVIISIPDIPEFPAALFGILKIGAVVVMVNPYQKPEELATMLDYTRAKVAIVHSDQIGEWTAAAESARFLKHLLVVGKTSDTYPSWEVERNRASETLENARTSRDDAALWLFSGGTTGRPKAVVQSHVSFPNTTECYAKGVLQLKESDITMSVPKLYFGYATGSNLLFPFSVGATSALFSERSTPEAVFENIRAFHPTVLINVPTMINQMVSHPDAGKQDLSSLRFTTSAGEALPVELYHRWKSRFKVEILDGLGTAEMWHIFISNRPNDVKPGGLGKVVPGFEVRLCDDFGDEVPVGDTGTMWVRGNSRALCYFNLMDQTRGAFRGDWYVSGDMLRKDKDGYYFYEGRADDMMKVSGKWVSPQDVENCLLKHPAVKECAVVGFIDKDGLTKPRAFVMLREGIRGTPGLAEELKEHVKESTDPHKYPRDIVFVDQLPRTHLGKVNRAQLKKA
jgi:benzoate-CoA ligase